MNLRGRYYSWRGLSWGADSEVVEDMVAFVCWNLGRLRGLLGTIWRKECPGFEYD